MLHISKYFKVLTIFPTKKNQKRKKFWTFLGNFEVMMKMVRIKAIIFLILDYLKFLHSAFFMRNAVSISSPTFTLCVTLLDIESLSETNILWFSSHYWIKLKKLFLILIKTVEKLAVYFQVKVIVTPGTHNSEHQVNKQLADKERVAAALENSHLIKVINQCIAPRRRG